VSAPREFAELITVGHVMKPQGRHGELLVHPLSDRPGRLPSLKRAFVPGVGTRAREVEVVSCWPHKGRFVLKLLGVDSINDAEGYRGLDLRIDPEQLEALPEGSYYHYQLVGLQAFQGGRELGRVESLLETGAGAPVLVLRGPSGETLLPLASEFVPEIDLARGRMEVRLPEAVMVPARTGA